jgi:hypothetical protein
MCDEVKRRCDEGRLHLLRTRFPSATEQRVICVSTLLRSQIEGPWDSDTEAARWGRVRADLESFVQGDIITIPKEGQWRNAAYMLRLIPPSSPEVWEIRSRAPKPSIRLFGRFAAKDFFVALLWEWRIFLGGPRSRMWRDVSVQCTTEWRGLFPSYDPASGDYPDAYLSDSFLL